MIATAVQTIPQNKFYTNYRNPSTDSQEDEHRKKKSANALINLISSSIDTLDNKVDDAPSPARGIETPDNPQQSRSLGKLLIDSLDDDLGDARKIGNAALGDGPATRKKPSSFSKRRGPSDNDSTRFGDNPNGNSNATSAATRVGLLCMRTQGPSASSKGSLATSLGTSTTGNHQRVRREI